VCLMLSVVHHVIDGGGVGGGGAAGGGLHGVVDVSPEHRQVLGESVSVFGQQ